MKKTAAPVAVKEREPAFLLTGTLTQTPAAGGKGRGGESSRSAAPRLRGRPEGHCRWLCCRSPAGSRTASLAWRAWRGKDPGLGLDRRLRRGLVHSVWHCEDNKLTLSYRILHEKNKAVPVYTDKKSVSRIQKKVSPTIKVVCNFKFTRSLAHRLYTSVQKFGVT